MNNLSLAYLGDAVYELYVRKFLISKNITKVNDLQTESLKYVTAPSQRKILENLLNNNVLNEDEKDIVRKGRNTASRRSKTTDVVTYHLSTGFECLIGYLYLNNPKRLEEIMEIIL